MAIGIVAVTGWLADRIVSTLSAASTTVIYHADGTADDTSGLHNGSWTCNPNYGGGAVGSTPDDQSFAFYGSNCHVVTDTQVGTFGTDPATIDFWILSNPAMAGQMQAVMGARAYCDNPSEGWWDIRVGTSPVSNNAPGTLIVEFGGSSYGAVLGQTDVIDGNWHHVVVHRSNTGISINVDGAADGATVAPASAINPSVPAAFGTSACVDVDGTRAPYLTYLDEIKITRGNPGVGPPTDKNQCKNDGWKSFNVPRRFKNQGDCIQFVNTGK